MSSDIESIPNQITSISTTTTSDISYEGRLGGDLSQPLFKSTPSTTSTSEVSATISIPSRPHESTASGHENLDVAVSDSNEFGKTTSGTDSSSPTTLQQLTTSATSIPTPEVTSYEGTGSITKISSLSILFISLITTLLF
ncbi:uncharacterized protein RJT20DRAFT_5196 [Scheffersomyces xylosifermentans]|uniref:uncharacterized protein n=1 Tax=Scheffersomyces xylosifermentans TaxID=1304137 RepID=UPI00315C7437